MRRDLPNQMNTYTELNSVRHKMANAKKKNNQNEIIKMAGTRAQIF
jgi:hypothetical protein